MEPVEDENTKSVLHIRYGVIVVLLAVALIFF
jgi:Flp pilus assembly pilin Flp